MRDTLAHSRYWLPLPPVNGVIKQSNAVPMIYKNILNHLVPTQVEVLLKGMRHSRVQHRKQTCSSTPTRDAASVVGLEQVSGPGDAHGTDGWVLIHTSFFKWKRLQLYQRNVILIGSGIVAAEVSEYNGNFLIVECSVDGWMDGWMSRWTDTWGGYGYPELEQCLWCSELLTSSTGKTLYRMHLVWAWWYVRELRHQGTLSTDSSSTSPVSSKCYWQSWSIRMQKHCSTTITVLSFGTGSIILRIIWKSVEWSSSFPAKHYLTQWAAVSTQHPPI